MLSYIFVRIFSCHLFGLDVDSRIRSTVAMHHSHSGPLTSDSLESPALLEMGQSPNHPGDTVDDVCSPTAQTM